MPASYATVDQAIATIGEDELRVLARDVNAADGIDRPKIQGALDDGTAEANSYLGVRLAVPLTSVPAIVQAGVIALAYEILDKGERENIRARASRFRAWLKDASRGVATLGVNEGSDDAPAVAGDGGGVLIDSPPRVFDDAGLAGYLGSGY